MPLQSKRRRSLSCAIAALLAGCADRGSVGNYGGTSGSDTTSSGSTGASVGATTTADATSSSSDGPGSSSGEIDTASTTLWIIDDYPSLDCPIGTRVHTADVSGTTPLGVLGLYYGWFGVAGGGKCPEAYAVEFYEYNDGVMTSNLTRLVLSIEVAPETGDRPLIADLWLANGDHATAMGTATITAVTVPDDPMPHLMGSFTIDDPEWTLGGSFDIPWCELLQPGPCGA